MIAVILYLYTQQNKNKCVGEGCGIKSTIPRHVQDSFGSNLKESRQRVRPECMAKKKAQQIQDIGMS